MQNPPSHVSGTTERWLVDNKTLSSSIEGQIQSRFVLFASTFVCKHWNINIASATQFNAHLHIQMLYSSCHYMITFFFKQNRQHFFLSKFAPVLTSCHLRHNLGKTTCNEYFRRLLELVLGQLNQKNKLSNTSWKKDLGLNNVKSVLDFKFLATL
jgi:hypothetical protein